MVILNFKQAIPWHKNVLTTTLQNTCDIMIIQDGAGIVLMF